MAATKQQIMELAGVIEDQALAIANGLIPDGQLWAQVKRLEDNIATLKAWVPDDRR